jgi:hypothetical protein
VRLHAGRRQARSGDFNDQRQPAPDSGRSRPKQRIDAFHIDQSPRDKMMAHDRKMAVAGAAVEWPAKIATSALPYCAGAEALPQGERPPQSIILRPDVPILAGGSAYGFKA